MTRKHYKMIADVLSVAIDENWDAETIAKKLSAAFESDSNTFSRDMFLSHIGIPVEAR